MKPEGPTARLWEGPPRAPFISWPVPVRTKVRVRPPVGCDHESAGSRCLDSEVICARDTPDDLDLLVFRYSYWFAIRHRERVEEQRPSFDLAVRRCLCFGSEKWFDLRCVGCKQEGGVSSRQLCMRPRQGKRLRLLPSHELALLAVASSETSQAVNVAH